MPLCKSSFVISFFIGTVTVQFCSFYFVNQLIYSNESCIYFRLHNFYLFLNRKPTHCFKLESNVYPLPNPYHLGLWFWSDSCDIWGTPGLLEILVCKSVNEFSSNCHNLYMQSSCFGMNWSVILISPAPPPSTPQLYPYLYLFQF